MFDLAFINFSVCLETLTFLYDSLFVTMLFFVLLSSPVKFSEHFEDNEMSVPDSPAVVSSDNVHVAIQNTPERKPVDIEESDQQKVGAFSQFAFRRRNHSTGWHIICHNFVISVTSLLLILQSAFPTNGITDLLSKGIKLHYCQHYLLQNCASHLFSRNEVASLLKRVFTIYRVKVWLEMIYLILLSPDLNAQKNSAI